MTLHTPGSAEKTHMRLQLLSLMLAVPLYAFSPILAAQDRILDQGQFLIYRGSDIVGREEFVVRKGRATSGSDYSIVSASFYPPHNLTPSATWGLELGPDSQPTTVRIDVNGGDRPSVFVRFERRRITVRTVTPSGESARQFPAAGRALVLDELFISGYLIPPGLAEGTIILFRPRTSLRLVTTLKDDGMEQTSVGGRSRSLRHLKLESAAETHHIWFDDRGRLIKLEIPSDDLTAVRIPPSGR